jgi:hypothetical protein
MNLGWWGTLHPGKRCCSSDHTEGTACQDAESIAVGTGGFCSSKCEFAFFYNTWDLLLPASFDTLRALAIFGVLGAEFAVRKVALDLKSMSPSVIIRLGERRSSYLFIRLQSFQK